VAVHFAACALGEDLGDSFGFLLVLGPACTSSTGSMRKLRCNIRLTAHPAAQEVGPSAAIGSHTTALFNSSANAEKTTYCLLPEVPRNSSSSSSTPGCAA